MSYNLIEYRHASDGTVFDGVNTWPDYLPAFNRIQALVTDYKTGAAIQVPAGDYWLSDTFHMFKMLHIKGAGFGVRAGVSSLKWLKNKTGIRCWNGDEVNTALNDVAYGPYPAFGPGGNFSSACFTIEDIALLCPDDSATSGHGLHTSSNCHLNRVSVQGFGGDGIRIFAYNPQQGGVNAGTGNANQWYMSDCIIRSNGADGLFVQGADANAGVCIMGFGGNNHGWDFVDRSWLGNTYIACQSDAPGIGANPINGSYKSEAPNNYIGCYSETKVTAFSSTTTLIGGNFCDATINSGQLNIAGYSQTFNAQSAVNSGTDKITLTAAATHFPVGYQVTYNIPNGGTAIGGLVDNGTYYVKAADATTITLAATVGGATIDITALGSSQVHTLSVGSGAKAVIIAVDASGAATKILPIYYGSDYTSAVVSVVPYKSGDGSGLTVTPHIDAGGHITSYTIDNGGAGYVGHQSPALLLASASGTVTYAPSLVQNFAPTSGRYSEAVIGADAHQFFAGRMFNNTSNDYEQFNVLRWNQQYNSSYEMAISGRSGEDDRVSVRWISHFSPTETMGRAGNIPWGSIQFPDGFWIGGGQNNSSTLGRYVTNDTAAPTTGQWARGDIIWNTVPSAGGTSGWMCVTAGDFAGTPPVFKAMANLAA